MRKKKREHFDVHVSRVLLVLLGTTFLALGIVFLYQAGINEPKIIFILLSSAIALLGAVFLFTGIFSSESNAIKWAERTGNHELLIVFVLLAYAIASITKRDRK